MRVPVPRSALLWFGVLGAPAAWTAQHIAGFALTEARCQEVGRVWDIPMDTWTIAVTAPAAVIAALAAAASVVTWRATRDAGHEPPPSRIHFMSVMGMTLAPLFLLIILMSGLGAIFLPECVQS